MKASELSHTACSIIDERIHDSPLAASFRDPDGVVFARDGVLYRQVNASYREDYAHLIGSGLYDALTAAGLLIPHEEAATAPLDARAHLILRPERIPFLSYPYEWCFSQLKAAALATLAIEEHALAHGMSLKDASAYNIQFRGSRPVLIDTLSFERYRAGRPWAAYRQFCQHFLAPLTLMALVDVRLGQLLRVHLDGVPLDLASRLLPVRTRLSFSLASHLHLHARAERAFSQTPVDDRHGRVSEKGLRGLLDNLRATIEKLSWRPPATDWATYDDVATYSSEARAGKERFVRDRLAQASGGTVWDLGANTGRFTRIAAASAAHVVAIDADPGVTELQYQSSRTGTDGAILPLVVDLTNPSPAIGWSNAERSSILERGPADSVLALALVHHLAIGNNLPFDRIAAFLHDAGRRLIVEFVPRDDVRAQQLLIRREHLFDGYTREEFERGFERHFAIHDVVPLAGSGRLLYYMQRRGGTA